MSNDSISLIDQKNVDSITESVSKLYADVQYNSEAFSLPEIANGLGLTTDKLIEYYGSRSGLMSQILDHVEDLCQKEVFDIIKTCTQSGIKKIMRLARLIEQFFRNHPECSYWFKAHFCSDVILTDTYPKLVQFFDNWRLQIQTTLLGIIPSNFIEFVATAYLDTIKACLLNDDGFGACSSLFSSKYFIWKTTGRLINQDFD